jgi:cell division septum initiation protein DivIVA
MKDDTNADIEQLKEENEALKQKNETLKKRLRALRKQLDSYRGTINRQWRDNADYLPHPDREDGRD